MFKINSVYMNPQVNHSMTLKTSNLYRVYKNPNAKDLFIKAQNAKSAEERAKLFEEMGEYELVTEQSKTLSRCRLFQFLKGLLKTGF